MSALPNLATDAPLWLGLVTVGVNAVVGALRGYSDEAARWDIVGVTVFALLMGLGGGFIRDTLIGDLPAESLRSPWFVVTVLACVALVLLVGRYLVRLAPVMTLLDALALGLFAISGAAYALRAGLPVVSAVLVGTTAAVGGSVLVSIMQDEIPAILEVSAPQALLAALASCVYVGVAVWSPQIAAVAALVVCIASRYAADWLGLRTQPAKSPSAVLLTRRTPDRDR